MRYGDFNGRVDWSSCLLQVETPLGKHFLQGNGTESGLMENIIITEEKYGKTQAYTKNFKVPSYKISST